MVDSLRAALRLLPAVRPSIGGTSGSRVPKARIHSASEQSALLALKVHPQITNCEKVHPVGPGIVRFARAVLAYVGAGLSAVTANQFAGPPILQAKELGSGVGGNHTVGAAEARGMWQRNSANRHLAQEDAIRSPKFGHCPLPHIVSKSQADACHSVGHSYYWNNNWGTVDARFSPDTKLDPQWQVSPGTNRDYRSKLGGLDEGLNSRFSKPTGLQALAAESNFSMKSTAGLMGSVSYYGTAAELELEWQLIIDPKPKSGQGSPTYDSKACEQDEEVTFELKEAVRSNAVLDEPRKTQLVNTSKVVPSNIMTNSNKQIMTTSNKEVSTNAKFNRETMMNSNREKASESLCGDSTDKQQTMTRRSGVVCQDISKRQDIGSTSTMSESLLSRTTDKEILGARVAQNFMECLEETDLPSLPTRSMSKTSLSNFDISTPVEKQGEMFQSLDKILLAEILHGNEPTWLEDSGLPSSALLRGNSGPTTAAPVHFQRVSRPLTIPSVEARPSSRRGSHSLRRNTSWNGGESSTTADQGSGLLGEALCRSQTRAREAEKKVQQAYDEKERLMCLFFQESSRSLTYRQWVTSLQAENIWLRKFAPNESLAWLNRSFVNPFSTVECMASRSWNDFGTDYVRRQMEHNVSATHEKDAVDLGESGSNNMMMGCTLGIAFALGLSLASAGLMLGWSMGWILLAYSVSV